MLSEKADGKMGKHYLPRTDSRSNNFLRCDGGREEAGYSVKNDAADCAVRAVVIAMGINYQDGYDMCKRYGFKPHSGMMVEDLRRLLKDRGWIWVPYNAVKGQPRVKLHQLRHERCIVNVSRHISVMVNDTVIDNHDPRRIDTGGRCVYGVWQKE